MNIEMPNDWYGCLGAVKSLEERGKLEEAYVLLRTVVEENPYKFDKYCYGTYEDYIIEKAKCFIELALLQLEVTKCAKDSVIYLDRALEVLDGMESVYPYVNVSEINKLKQRLSQI